MLWATVVPTSVQQGEMCPSTSSHLVYCGYELFYVPLNKSHVCWFSIDKRHSCKTSQWTVSLKQYTVRPTGVFLCKPKACQIITYILVCDVNHACLHPLSDDYEANTIRSLGLYDVLKVNRHAIVYPKLETWSCTLTPMLWLCQIDPEPWLSCIIKYYFDYNLIMTYFESVLFQ